MATLISMENCRQASKKTICWCGAIPIILVACTFTSKVEELSSRYDEINNTGTELAQGGNTIENSNAGSSGSGGSSENNGNGGISGAGGIGVVCATNQADCNGIPDDGCEVSVVTDPKNCGRCQHDCKAGTCEQSICQPFLVTDQQEDITSIYADENHVYWMTGSAAQAQTNVGNAGQMRRTAADGSRGDSSIATFYYAPFYSNAVMTGDASTLFWAQRNYDHNYVFAIDKGVTGKVRTLLYRQRVAIVGDSHARQIVTDASSIFYTGVIEIGTVSKLGSSSQYYQYTGMGHAGRNIAVDETYLFVLHPSTGDLIRIKKDGTQAWDGLPVWVKEQQGGFALVTNLTDPFVYWFMPGAGEIRKAARADTMGQPTLFFATNSSPSTLALDETFLYWISPSTGEIVAMGKEPAAQPRTLASSQSNPRHLSITKRAVYWSVRNTAIYGVVR